MQNSPSLLYATVSDWSDLNVLLFTLLLLFYLLFSLWLHEVCCREISPLFPVTPPTSINYAMLAMGMTTANSIN